MRKFPLAFTILMILAVATARLAAQIVPAPDEKQLEQIIADMGSDDPAVRMTASRRLEAAGPDIVPMLQKYLHDDSPEIAARVKAIISSFKWMNRGAIILNVEDGSQAARIGMRGGDVIVKVNDQPIATHLELHDALIPDPTVIYLWRAGHVLSVTSTGGKLGITTSNWEIALGGNDHSRGIAAFNAKPPDYAQAYRRLRAAHDQGMKDAYSLSILTGLAARALDGAYAAKVYAENLPNEPWTAPHDVYDYRLGNIPYDSPQCQSLLKRYREDPFSMSLYNEVEDYLTRFGRNGPMAEQVFDKPWPVSPLEINDVRRYYHEVPEMLIRLQQHRYDQVLDTYNQRMVPRNVDYDRDTVAVQAAVRGGQGAVASRIGLSMFSEKHRRDDQSPAAALWGFASAAAQGDNTAADAFLAGLDELNPDKFAKVLQLHSMDALNQPAAAERIRVWLAGRPRQMPPERFEQIALARLIASPKSTAEEFVAALQGIDSKKLDESWKFTCLTGYLRFEKYAQATQAATALKAARPNSPPALQGPRERALAAIAFAQAHGEQFSGPWKEARGILQVAEDGSGTTWLLRYDGAVFRVDPARVLTRIDGLPIPPAPLTAAYRHLRVTPGTVAILYPYGRGHLDRTNNACPDMTFIFDPQRNRCIPLAESGGPLDLGDANHRETARALAIRAVAKAYPPLPGSMPREYQETHGYHRFEGDILIYVDEPAKKLTDLSMEIGRLAGLKRPAHVYRVEHPAKPQWLFTDCGIWTLDPATQTLARLPLGRKDENVMTCEMPESLYGHRDDGCILVGVAPQQGGAVYIVDVKTGKVQSTDGFCGFGPADWFGTRGEDWTRRDPQPAIHAQYLARLAGH